MRATLWLQNNLNNTIYLLHQSICWKESAFISLQVCFFYFIFFIFFFIITNLNGIEWSNNPVSFIETLLLAIFANQRNLFVQREVDVKFALGKKDISCGFYPYTDVC